MILDTDSTPPGWRLSTFGREMLVRGGLVDPRDPVWSGTVLIAPNHIESGTGRVLARETAAEQGADSGKYAVRAGDLIYSKIRPALNKVAVATEDCLCSADMYPVVPAKEADVRFCQYYMLADPFLTYAALAADRVKMPKVNREELSGAPWLVPALAEQRRIADYLDRETATIDDLIDNQHELLTKLKERRSAVIRHHLETGACMTDPVMGEVELNKPGWKCLPAKRVCNIRTGGEDSGNATDGGEFPFYVRGARVLRSEDYAFEGPAVLTPGDGQGGTGKVFHCAEGRFQAHQRVYVFHGFRGLVAKYFYYWLSTFLREIALASSYTVTMESLRQPMLERLPVFFPEDPAEQDAIVQAIEADVAKIDALIAKAERFIELAQERRAALITAAVTGQIEIPTED